MSDNLGKAICEAILSKYKELETLCARAEAKAVLIARRSRNRKVYTVIDEMTALTNEKIAYINAKVIIDTTLSTLPNTVELRKYYIDGHKRQPIWNERVGEKKEQLFKAILKKYKTQELLDLIRDSQLLMDEVRHQKKLLDKVEKQS